MGADQSLILEKAASALERLEKENAGLREEVASFQKRDRCEKIAMKMIEKGMIHNEAEIFVEKVAFLMESDRLDIVEEAVELNVHALSLGSEDDRQKTASAKGLNPVDALILEDEYNDR